MNPEQMVLSWTVEGRPGRTDIAEALAGVSDRTLERLWVESLPLAKAGSLAVVRDMLIRGAIEYQLVVYGDHRFAVSHQIRDELWYHSVGGPTKGADPFEGFSALWAFVDAADLDPDLRSASCFAGRGIVAETAKEATILDMFAIAMAAENIAADTSSRIINKVATALGVR